MKDKKILIDENIDITDNKSKKQTKENNNKNIILIKILIAPSIIDESEKNKNHIENTIYTNENENEVEDKSKDKDNNKKYESYICIKKNLSQNLSFEQPKNGLLLGKKRKNIDINHTKIHKQSNLRKTNLLKKVKNNNANNSIQIINDIPNYYFNSNFLNEKSQNISSNLSLRLNEEKREMKKMDITEKIRRSLDKKKTDSSSKKINIDWINWINEVISSSNENKINKNNNIYKNKQQPFLSPKTNEDLKKNFSYDSLKNIAKIRSNNQFFK